MYHYRGPRNADAWNEFVKSGYQNAESEEIPLEASALRNFIKEFGRFFIQLRYAAEQQPWLFGGLFGGFFILLIFTCCIGEPDKKKEAPAAAAAAEKKQE